MQLLTPAILGPLYLLAVAVPLAIADAKTHRLPNRLVLPAFPVTLLGQLTALVLAAFEGDFLVAGSALTQALLAGVLAFGAGLLANRFGSLGMGDVKLVAAIALALGWFSPFSVLVALTLSFAIGVLALGFLALRHRREMGRSIALGPYLLVGFGVACGLLAWPAPVLTL